MADAEHTTPGLVPGLVQEFIGQLRAVTEKLEGLTGLSGHLPATPSVPPLPGALSARLPAAAAISGISRVTPGNVWKGCE